MAAPKWPFCATVSAENGREPMPWCGFDEFLDRLGVNELGGITMRGREMYICTRMWCE